ncbi:MAG: 1-(5-phosphoribosyl)-5-[(5-phosphoribosylamino)methylideneamino]imidazole-4-carboxamide isomerase [Rhodospirillaceae bacterium]|nr:1-(5-phosphoribosyl)-5-[(5-phosphoribosylamino)methylideneamino]imidazole-4-carboxamide isomerase [Rhodospirillaceae bacterium]
MSLVFFPAIDIKDGKCVRLIQGKLSQVTVFNDSPASQALLFSAAGAEWIHVVDLDGAFGGRPINMASVKEVLANASCKVQLGGGIRTLATIEHWLEAGIDRVVLGTVALKQPQLVADACRLFPGKIAVGIDTMDGYVAVDGWANVSEISPIDLGKRFQDAGVSVIVHTDIQRDGVLAGPNFKASFSLAKSINIPVIISGGVSSLADLALIKNHCKGSVLVEGVISGRAIYDGLIDVSQAVSLLSE